ncbi:MAG: hydroxymethylbilane synthase [Thermoflavifilum sp.]|nr:hydroxymethylbilane synthase [Thermoflavifilum sp.]
MIHEPLRIGTRSSKLALWQAAQVQLALQRCGLESQIITVESEGDVDVHTPLYAMGVQGVFTRQLDIALLNKRIDLAVHSLKDVPVQLAQGTLLAAVLPRGPVEDMLLCRNLEWIDIPNSVATIATGSIRRRAAWQHRYPHHSFVNLRGNIQTRVRKFRESSWQGALFARAALDRLQVVLNPEEKLIPLPWMIPAPAQGAIGVTIREEDTQLYSLCQQWINDASTALCVAIERRFLQELHGGCSTPICALARVENSEVVFTAQILSADGRQALDICLKKPITTGIEIAIEAAQLLLQQGAQELLTKSTFQ